MSFIQAKNGLTFNTDMCLLVEEAKTTSWTSSKLLNPEKQKI
jgi:hypothetical protein